jgi:hypothetical protein
VGVSYDMKNFFKGSSLENTVLWSIPVINCIRLFPVAHFFKVIKLEDAKGSVGKAAML